MGIISEVPRKLGTQRYGNGLRERERLKKESEGFLMATLNQALRTNRVKKLIDNQNVSSTCRICGERAETLSHLSSRMHCTCTETVQVRLSTGISVRSVVLKGQKTGMTTVVGF